MLDVAGGTGDISFKILEKAKLDNLYTPGENIKSSLIDITVSDINPDMLEVGKRRAIE